MTFYAGLENIVLDMISTTASGIVVNVFEKGGNFVRGAGSKPTKCLTFLLLFFFVLFFVLLLTSFYRVSQFYVE